MDVVERSATRIYSLSTGPTLPEWLGERARRNLSKRDSAIRRRIELLQDFQMPCASSRLRQSHDGRYILAAGTYHPRIRVYELEEMGMKFETYLDSEVVDMTFLGSDYGKIAMLLDNRTISFRAPYGIHTTMRIPTFGRAMAYEPTTCELLVACSGKGRSTTTDGTGSRTGSDGGEVYRINLEEGRFSAPLVYSATSSSSKSSAVVGGSSIAISPAHPLTALGCEDGLIRFWDNRVPQNSSGKPDSANLNPFLNLDVKSSTAGYGFYDDSNLATQNPGEIRSLAFDAAGLNMVAGTAGGVVALYDMRTSRPLHVKEHQYGLPIHTVRFHSGSGTVMSADSKLVKIWRAKPSSTSAPALAMEDDVAGTGGSAGSAGGGGSGDDGTGTGVGSIVSNIEGTADFNHFIVAGDEADPKGDASGLVLCAGEQPKMQSFYVPALGPAPRWCSFLDSITEELEERDRAETSAASGAAGSAAAVGSGAADGIYEDYKFLTRDEIESMGMQSLVGTPLLRGYMHGFFVDVGLYNRIKAVANPFEYEEYRKKKLKEKMEAKRASRIAPRKSAGDRAAVNPELASRLLSKANDGKNTKSTKLAKTIMSDDRFGSLFKNPDFQIDEEDINFKLRNPSGVAEARRAQDDDMDSDQDGATDDGEEGSASGDSYDEDDEILTGFKRAGEGDEDNGDEESESDAGRWSSSDDDEDEIRGENYDQVKAMEKASKKKKRASKIKDATRSKDKRIKAKKNIMFEADDYGGGAGDALGLGLGDTSASSKAKRRRDEISLPLEKRLQKQKENAKYTGETKLIKVKGEGSTKEVAYVPLDTRKKMEAAKAKKADEAADKDRRRKRRNVKDLGFKTPFKNKM